jgi:hypothetical protein
MQQLILCFDRLSTNGNKRTITLQRMPFALSVSKGERGLCSRLNTLPEFIDEVQDQTDDNTDDDARCQWKVKRKIFFFDQKVSGKLSQKGQARENQNHEADQDQERPDEDHDLCDLAHNNIPNPDKPKPKSFFTTEDTEVKCKENSCCYEILHTSHCVLCGLCG